MRMRRFPPFAPTIDITIGIIIAAATTTPSFTSSLLLLSDLPTPSFIIDTQVLLRRHDVVIAANIPMADDANTSVPSSFDSIRALPSIRCPKNGLLLSPSIIADRGASMMCTKTTTKMATNDAEDILDCNFEVIEGRPSLGYIHSSVVRAREDVILGVDDPISTFLAEIDFGSDLCGGNERDENIGIRSGGARLVLGLNNHHVGSYYWARSAGTGSSMEAPGISFGSSSTAGGSSNVGSRGTLRWMEEEGPEACNSNDGKRSEWVNFLRRGDTVQLVPMDGQDTILRFSKRFGRSQQSSTTTSWSETNTIYPAPTKEENTQTRSIRVFGITSQGRPLGSEPEVICEWTPLCTWQR